MQTRENNQNCRQQKEKQTSDSRETESEGKPQVSRPVCAEQGRKAACFSPLLFPFPRLPAERGRGMMGWKSHCRRTS